jgi:hypothetical protein
VIEFRAERSTNLGKEHGGSGCHRYLRYVVSGRPMRRQSNSLRTKGQLAASYSGYDASTTQLPLYTSHDEPPAWGCSCSCVRRMAVFFPAVAVVQAARRMVVVTKSKPRRFILELPVATGYYRGAIGAEGPGRAGAAKLGQWTEAREALRSSLYLSYQLKFIKFNRVGQYLFL